MKKLVALVVIALFVFVPSRAAHADVNDFVVNNFAANYRLTNEDNQGTLHIEERLTVTFTDYNHGILRAIPKEYKDKSLKLTIGSVTYGDGSSVPLSTYSENDNLVLKIGDPDKTVTGKVDYVLNYSVSNVISFEDSHDELYWDINGDDWVQLFEQVSITLQLPSELKLQEDKLTCYTGRFGSGEQACVIAAEGDRIEASSNVPLHTRETLTIVAGFDKGFFRPQTAAEYFRDILPTILKISLPSILVGGYAFRRWRKYGRDPKGRGTIVPEYGAPDALGPAEVGTVADFRTDQREITATILDLAIRGYIQIIEEKKDRKLFPDTIEYSLKLLKTDVGQLKEHEGIILTGLFNASDFSVGTVVNMKDLKNNFYKDVAEAQKSVTKHLVTEKYFASNPAMAGGRLWVLFVLLIIAASLFGALLGPAVVVGFGISLVLVFIFALSMPARTEKGVAVKEHALGLKLYLETAEKDRIAMMQSPDAPYTRTTAPVKTVELYEKLLPYAVVFSVEKQWSEQFKDIYKQMPNWYVGSNVHAFNSVYLASALGGSMNSAMTTAFSSPSSSSSSGFGGGGGFSGGGGGGGGGGGW